MAITVRNKPFNIAWWNINGSNIERQNLCNVSTTFYLIDPTLINNLGGTKSSALTANQIDSNLKYVTSGTWSNVAANFINSNWSAKGWTVSDEAAFLDELQTWISLNFNNQTLNPNLTDVTFVTVRGTLNGSDYSVVFCFFGNQGSEIGVGEIFISKMSSSFYSNNYLVASQTSKIANIWGRIDNNYGIGSLDTNTLFTDINLAFSPLPITAGSKSFVGITAVDTEKFFGIDANSSQLYGWGNYFSGSNNSPVEIGGGRSFDEITSNNQSVYLREKNSGNLYILNSTYTSPVVIASSYQAIKLWSCMLNVGFIDKNSYLPYKFNDINPESFSNLPSGKKFKNAAYINFFGTEHFSLIDSNGNVWQRTGYDASYSQVTIPGNSGKVLQAEIASLGLPGINILGKYYLTDEGKVYCWSYTDNTSTSLAVAPGHPPLTPNVQNTNIEVVPIPTGAFINEINTGDAANRLMMYDKTAGKIYGYGMGTYGALGPIYQIKSPTLISGHSFSKINAPTINWSIGSQGTDLTFRQGASTTYGIDKNTGYLKVWGGAEYPDFPLPYISDEYYINGNTGGPTGSRSIPTIFLSQSFIDLATAHLEQMPCLGLAADGTIYRWGSANGLGLASSSTPIVLTLDSTPSLVSLTCGGGTYIGLDSSGLAYSWGSNYYYQFGDGTNTSSVSSFVAVSGNISFSKVDVGQFGTIGIEKDTGLPYIWGNQNLYSNVIYSTPTLLTGRTFSDIAAFKGFMGTYESGSMPQPYIGIEKDTGYLLGWGLKDVSNTYQGSSPVVIDSSRSYKKVVAGYGNALIIDSSGQVYYFGLNNGSRTFLQAGTPGAGTLTSSTVYVSPIPIMNTSSFVDIGCGMWTNFAMQADGTTYAWGLNGTWGSLGIGQAGWVWHNSPVEIPGTFL